MLRQLLKVFSISLRKSIQNIIIIQRLSAKECFSVKFSRTEKMKKSFTRIGVSIWNSIPLVVKTLNISNFRKKNKTSLLNVLGNEDNFISMLIINRIFYEVNLICCIYLQL